jgi:hypothetical protein
MLDRPRISGNSVTVSFELNGNPVSVPAEPFVTLALALREKLGMTGTKIGCDAGDCGPHGANGRRAGLRLLAGLHSRMSADQTVEGWAERTDRPLQVSGARGGTVRHLHARHADGGDRLPDPRSAR